MYKCEICGREIKKKNRIYGKTVCSKHMHQMLKYGHALDNIPRTNADLNEIIITGDIAVVMVYNQKNLPVSSFIIDAEDVSKIKYHKWRIDTNHRIITGNCTNKHPRKEIGRLLLGVFNPELVVDHINGNSLDNRKCNLRICSQAENTYNKSRVANNHSEFIGVSWDKTRYKWAAEIRKGHQRSHIGRYSIKSEAVYARYIAEKILFKEYRNTNQDDIKLKLFEEIPENRKQEIESYVRNKLTSKYNLCA